MASPQTDSRHRWSFPVAWYEATGANQQFTVFTGDVTPGAAGSRPSDHTFDVMDACM